MTIKLTLTTKEKDVLYNLIVNPNTQGEMDWNEKEFQNLSYKIKKLKGGKNDL